MLIGSMLERVNRSVEYKVKKTKDISCINIGHGAMDSTYVNMNYFDGRKSENEQKYVIYSIGIGDQINFELDLLDKLSTKHIDLYAIDPTPKSLEFLKKQSLPSNFHVLPYALAEKDCELEFAIPKNEGWVSGTAAEVRNDGRDLDMVNKIRVQGRSLRSIMKELGHSKINLLKMDIEGSEFDIMDSCFDGSIEIHQLLLDHHEQMLKNNRRERIRHLDELLKKNYDIFYTNDKGKSLSCMMKGYS